MELSKSLSEIISKNPKWKTELLILTDLAASCNLEANIKWGMPVYSYKNKNVVGIGPFKNFICIWFYQGALLKDVKKKFTIAQEGVAKALRKWHFHSIDEIEIDAALLKKYILEAKKLVDEGKEIKPEKNKSIIIAKELQELFKQKPNLKKSFDSLSITLKREFAQYINTAKLQKTREDRIRKIQPLLLKGISLYEKYKK